ncbi:hypothetical protein SAMN05421636_107323 [Pricia antarctica]|uniref:Uncharacterized protein n=1 Tax=Pricia antarctica TaxID=641691 RepID=A0A1G7FXS7_9FLAO|nr:hypothetical protein SAMN05421636_107323 [Pricia antarctica]
MFANLETQDIQPFFSRRLGLNVPVFAGGRLSGKLGDDWRIGVMDMQTGLRDYRPSTNFAAAVLQRQVFSRSNILAFLVNKSATGTYNDSLDSLYSEYNKNAVAGLEYNVASLLLS